MFRLWGCTRRLFCALHACIATDASSNQTELQGQRGGALTALEQLSPPPSVHAACFVLLPRRSFISLPFSRRGERRNKLCNFHPSFTPLSLSPSLAVALIPPPVGPQDLCCSSCSSIPTLLPSPIYRLPSPSFPNPFIPGLTPLWFFSPLAPSSLTLSFGRGRRPKVMTLVFPQGEFDRTGVIRVTMRGGKIHKGGGMCAWV